MFSHTTEAKAALFFMTAEVMTLEQATEITARFLKGASGHAASRTLTDETRAALACGPVRVAIEMTTGDALVPGLSRFWGQADDLSAAADIQTDAKLSVQIAVSVVEDETGTINETLAAPVLAGTAFAIAEAAQPDCLQWLKPTAWTTGADFMRVLAPAPNVRPAHPTLPEGHRRSRPIKPRRVHTGATARTERPLPAGYVPLSEDAIVVHPLPCASNRHLMARTEELRHTFRDPMQIDPSLSYSTDEVTTERTAAERLTAWSLSLTVATFSLPIASSLVVYNLLKGEDMRVSAHTMALTGLLVVLGSSGAFAQVASVLGV